LIFLTYQGGKPLQSPWQSLQAAGDFVACTELLDVDAVELGISRIGGLPDLPAKFKWPNYKGQV
jgi:hypothetical protein